MHTDIMRVIKACKAAVVRGSGYLLERFRPDGTYADVGKDLVAYYKSPYVSNRLEHVQQSRLSLQHVITMFFGQARQPSEKRLGNQKLYIRDSSYQLYDHLDS